MVNSDVFVLRKSNRTCYMLPWGSDKIPCPWKSGYARVMIPLTESERLNSNKTCHVQVVKIDNIRQVRATRIC